VPPSAKESPQDNAIPKRCDRIKSVPFSPLAEPMANLLPRIVAILSAPLLLAGCSLASNHLRRDIERISPFYSTRAIWLNFEDPPTNVPEGLKFTVFLGSARETIGVFGDGTMIVEMFRVDHDDQGKAIRVSVKKWSYNTEQCYPFRSKRRTRYGWGYGLRLPWGDADVLGEEIVLVVSFKRLDGISIHSQPKYLKVPVVVYPDRA